MPARAAAKPKVLVKFLGEFRLYVSSEGEFMARVDDVMTPMAEVSMAMIMRRKRLQGAGADANLPTHGVERLRYQMDNLMDALADPPWAWQPRIDPVAFIEPTIWRRVVAAWRTLRGTP